MRTRVTLGDRVQHGRSVIGFPRALLELLQIEVLVLQRVRSASCANVNARVDTSVEGWCPSP